MKNLKLYEDFVNEEDEGKIKDIKLNTEDEKKFKDSFTVDNKYMFDTKLSDEERKAILMAKIDAMAKRKRLNPGQAKKLKEEYAKEIAKMGDLDKVEQNFKTKYYNTKYKKSTGEKAKGYAKRLIAPDAGAVSSFRILDDFMADIFD